MIAEPVRWIGPATLALSLVALGVALAHWRSQPGWVWPGWDGLAKLSNIC